MDEEKRNRAIKALAMKGLFEDGVIPPNSQEFTRQTARILNHPHFWGLGITLREFMQLYLELWSDHMEHFDRLLKK